MYSGSVSVAVGDLTSDGVADIALGTNEIRARAQVFAGGTFTKLSDFKPGSNTNFSGSTQVALADVNADGTADLVVAAKYTTGTKVFGFDGTTLRPKTTRLRVFNAFTLSGSPWSNGLFLSAGDVNGDGYADLVLGTGAGTGPQVVAYSGAGLVNTNKRVVVADFVPEGATSVTGVRTGIQDVTGDGRVDVVTGSGTQVIVYDTSRPGPVVFRRVDTGYADGVYVG